MITSPISATGNCPALTTHELRELVGRLPQLDPNVSDAERIEQVSLLEQLQGASAGTAVGVMLDLETSQVEQQRARGVPARRRGADVASQIALACKVSPSAGSRRLGRARALRQDLPQTLAALRSGSISERVAEAGVRQTSHLTPDLRHLVDAELAARLPGWSPREAESAARRSAYEHDPEGSVERIARAAKDRAVWSRPAPDCMSKISALLPVKQGVAAYAALDQRARELRAQGDERSLAQLRADIFSQRLTGAEREGDIDVEVGLTISADALLDDGDEPAYLEGHGPIPAALARAIVAGNAQQDLDATGHPVGDTERLDEHAPGCLASAGRGEVARGTAWVRRIFTDPIDGTVTAIDPRRRLFSGALRRLIDARDRVCRTPFCDAPIRHRDHVTPYGDGGGTTASNGRGTCAHCNYVREMPGWTAATTQPGHPHPESRAGHADPPGREPPHEVQLRTPTGHTYRSNPPSALGPGALPRRGVPRKSCDIDEGQLRDQERRRSLAYVTQIPRSVPFTSIEDKAALDYLFGELRAR